MEESSGFPIDLTGAVVAQVAWPPRGFRMVLDGADARGRPLAGARLTLESVVNRFPLQGFLSEKRVLRRRVVPQKKGRPITYTDNACESYPLKLPAKLTHFRRSQAARASYADQAFTDCHGPPPSVVSGLQLYYFALAEKRFRARGPFPIVCARVSLVDGAGRPILGSESPSPRTRPTADHERLGRRFAEAILWGDLAAAFALVSKALRRRVGRAGFDRWVGDWAGAARPLRDGPEPARGLDEFLAVEVTDDADELWELVASGSGGVPPESILAIVTTCFVGRREERSFSVVEEAGELRVGGLR